MTTALAPATRPALARRLRVAALAACLALSLALPAAACSSEPTPTPELSVDDVLSGAAAELAALETAKFWMADEMESGAQFFQMTLKTVEGVVKTPDSFSMQVSVVNPGLGFVKIGMLGVGDQAYMQFSEDAPWLPLPLEQVPFNFGGIGVTLSELLPVVRNTAITGRESAGGVQAVRVEGEIVSEELSSLITDADPGHPIALTLWFEEGSHTLRQLRIGGQLYDDDAPETTRLVKIDDINAPVDIRIPETASGS